MDTPNFQALYEREVDLRKKAEDINEALEQQIKELKAKPARVLPLSYRRTRGGAVVNPEGELSFILGLPASATWQEMLDAVQQLKRGRRR